MPFGQYPLQPDPGQRLATNQWLPLVAVDRLLSLDRSLTFRRSQRGAYGPVRHDASGQVFVTLAGLEQCARWSWTRAQVEAAIAGRPIPPGPGPYHDSPRWPGFSKRKPTIEERAARLSAAAPRFPTPERVGLPNDDGLLPDLSDFPDTPDDLED